MTKVQFTHYMLRRCPMVANQPNQRGTVDHFRLGLLFAVGSAFAFGIVRAVREIADGGRLEPDRRRHRPAGGRRAGDGRLRHHRQARLVPRGVPAWQDRRRVRAGPDRRRAAVLLQRRRAPVGRRRAAAGVHRPDPRGRLAVGDHPASPEHPDAGRRRAGGGRNHVGAQRVFRRAHQRRSASAGAWPPRSARRATS